MGRKLIAAGALAAAGAILHAPTALAVAQCSNIGEAHIDTVGFDLSSGQLFVDGANFVNQGNSNAKPYMEFGGKAITVVSATNTTITAKLPSGVTDGEFQVYLQRLDDLSQPPHTEVCTLTNEAFYSLTVDTSSGSGTTGPAGPAGPQGPTGPQGVAGATGKTGASGPAGPTGATGAAGPKGDTGAAGSAGAQGVAGATGAAGPQGTAGAVGKTGATGPAGATGAVGAAGAKGATGATGAAGPQGVAGPAGKTGATGPTGPQGDAADLPAGLSNTYMYASYRGVPGGDTESFDIYGLTRESKAAVIGSLKLSCGSGGVFVGNVPVGITLAVKDPQYAGGWTTILNTTMNNNSSVTHYDSHGGQYQTTHYALGSSDIVDIFYVPLTLYVLRLEVATRVVISGTALALTPSYCYSNIIATTVLSSDSGVH
jgi:hypothetical protein